MDDLVNKVIKLHGDLGALGISYNYIPVCGIKKLTTNSFLPSGPLFTQGGVATDNGLAVTYAKQFYEAGNLPDLYDILSALNGARIFNRVKDDLETGAHIDFAIYSSDGNEITVDTPLTYRPGLKLTQINPGGQYQPDTGYIYAAISSSEASTTFAGYQYWRLKNSYEKGATNLLYAIAMQNVDTTDEDQIDGYYLCCLSKFHSGNNYGEQYQVTFISFNNRAYQHTYDYTVDTSEGLPVADGDFSDTTSTEDGYKGKGAHDHTSDKISAASDPVVSTAQVGFFHIYHVSSGSLSALSQYLFPDILGSLVNADLEGILRAFASVFAYRDNIQYIVDLHAIPVAPTDGAAAYVKVGALETDISVPAVASDYVNFDCGSLSIPENFASFLDYTHTRAKLFLPGVGFVDIKNEFWQSGVLNVKYKFNVVDGSFMCFVSATSSKSQLEETVIGQYGGTMCIHFPVMSQSYGAMMSGIVAGAAMISTGGAAEAAAMQQGKTAAAAAAQQTKAQGYFSALQAAPLQKTVQSSNSYNSSTSFLGNRTPYLMIERAVPNYAGYYNLESGVPLNVSLPLANIHGYTEIENIVFAGQTFATDEEIADIKEKLRNGVIF